jgi:hypothetical protein
MEGLKLADRERKEGHKFYRGHHHRAQFYDFFSPNNGSDLDDVC